MQIRLAFLLVFAGLSLGPAACTPALTPANPTEAAMSFSLTSTAFSQGGPIPVKFSCDGEDLSPSLAWTDPPAGTQSFALIMDDPDAPGGTWVHWVLYNIPSAARGLPEAVPPDARLADGSLHGKNSWGKLGYGGPCPPSGTHRYYFHLYALDTALDLLAGANSRDLTNGMKGHILGQAEWMGTYKR